MKMFINKKGIMIEELLPLTMSSICNKCVKNVSVLENNSKKIS